MAFRNLHHGCNLQHKLSGHLFAGRYKSLLIDEATPGLSGIAEIVSDSLPALRCCCFYSLFKTVCGACPPRPIRPLVNLPI